MSTMQLPPALSGHEAFLREGFLDDASGVHFAPWTDGHALGFLCTHPNGSVEYVYLNPSTSEGKGDANVFLYTGRHGAPSDDHPWHHYNVDDDLVDPAT